MHFSVRGDPLHSRALAITIVQRSDGRLDVSGDITDLRKRGFVPVGGDLQPSGVIHDMHLVAVVDRQGETLESVAASQPRVAFEASALSRGESCRDPIERIGTMAGARLDDGYGKRLSATIGGPRGCSHVFTLAQLLGSTVRRAIAFASARFGEAPGWRAGERIFRRDVVVDGQELPGGRLQLAARLSDLHFAPSPPVARPMDRFAAQHELRVLATVEVAELRLLEISADERRRTLATLEEAGWEECAAVGGLAGLRLAPGVNGKLIERFGARVEDRPLLDTLLMLTPALFQCVGALSEGWPAAAKQSPSLMGSTGGLPDSCYIWRRGGALNRVIEEELESGAFEANHPRARRAKRG
jgi:hypothetical protein